MKNISDNNLAENLVAIRKMRGISQETMAQELGISRYMVASYEKLYREPRLDVLIKISEIYDIPVDNLLKEKIKAKKE